VARALAATARGAARADEIERALTGLANSVRDELSALKADLEELRAGGEGIGESRPATAAAAEPEPPAEPEPAEPAPAEEPPPAPAAAPAPSAPPEAASAPAAAAPAGDGHEGARVIALNMALNGSSREETARYLDENFELENPEALLDEVYARVSG
jgi:hypothetical protein